MFRLLLALNLLLLNLYACKGGFSFCQQKIIDSNAVTSNIIQVPVKKHQRLLYSTQIPNAKVIKYDPFLSLYLIEDKKGFNYPFSFNLMNSAGVAGVTKKSVIKGKVLKHQVGLNKFATFSDALFTPSLLTSSCCALVGLVTPQGIIEKAYIERFVQNKNSSYADLGIRVKQEGKYVIVDTVDPYAKNNPFKKDDYILKYNGKKVTSASSFMKSALFSKVGTTQKLQIKRHQKILNITKESEKRFGGGYISDTFLERKGIYFGDDLRINRLNDAQRKNGLKLCDTLIGIDGKKVRNQEEAMQIISGTKKFKSLLIQRDDFQFFVQIN